MALPRDAHDPAVRGAAREIASARADPRRVSYLRRAGGDRRRRVRAPAARGRGFLHTPRSRPRAREGTRSARAFRRALWTRDGLLARARRLDAFVRAGDRADGDERDRRPMHPPSGGRGLQRETDEDRECRRRVFRRWRDEQRRVSRGAEHGGHLEIAVAFCVRKQRLRDGSSVRLLRGKSERGEPRGGLRTARRRGGRERRARGA